MGKHGKAHICVNKTGTDQASEYEGRNTGTVYASEVVNFSASRSHWRKEAGYSGAATVLL